MLESVKTQPYVEKGFCRCINIRGWGHSPGSSGGSMESQVPLKREAGGWERNSKTL